MTCHRRYIFTYPGEWVRGGYSRILARLQQACEADWWFKEPTVDGEPDALTFTFLVSGRDKWWVHHRAMELAVHCFYTVGLREADVPVPTWEKLAPHTHRGQYRIPAPDDWPL